MMIAQDKQRQSNLVKYEYGLEYRHCRDIVKYVGAAKEFNIGDLVDSQGVIAALVDDVVGVVVENKKTDGSASELVVLARGPAGISEAGIHLGSLNIDAVSAHLLTFGVKVLKAV